jgi:hypothetical protein
MVRGKSFPKISDATILSLLIENPRCDQAFRAEVSIISAKVYER